MRAVNHVFVHPINTVLRNIRCGCIQVLLLMSFPQKPNQIKIHSTVQVARWLTRWLGGLLVEHRTSVSQIRGSIPGQVAAV